MEEVARNLAKISHGERIRRKIKSMGLDKFSKNYKYHHDYIFPHQIIRQSHRIEYSEYQRQKNLVHPTPQSFAFSPFRINQINLQRQRSRSMMENNSFLRNYDERMQYRKRDDYFRKHKQIQRAKQINEQKSLLKIKKTKSVSKLRVICLSVYFICTLNKRVSNSISKRKKDAKQFLKINIKDSMATMQKYFSENLTSQITEYIQILESCLRHPRHNFEKEILRFLSLLTSKLVQTPIPVKIMETLMTVCSEYSFFPQPFLFPSQISRFQFWQQRGCICNVSLDLSCMITACFLGVRILCYNLLYRPWLAGDKLGKNEIRSLQLRVHFNRLKKVINQTGSVIYFLLIDNFIFPIDIIDRTEQEFKEVISLNRIQVIPFLQVLPKIAQKQTDNAKIRQFDEESDGQEQPQLDQVGEGYLGREYGDKTQIIVGQNRKFYNRIQDKYKIQLQKIETDLCQWISKVTQDCFTLKQKLRRQKVKKYLKI